MGASRRPSDSSITNRQRLIHYNLIKYGIQPNYGILALFNFLCCISDPPYFDLWAWKIDFMRRKDSTSSSRKKADIEYLHFNNGRLSKISSLKQGHCMNRRGDFIFFETWELDTWFVVHLILQVNSSGFDLFYRLV